MKIEFSNEQFRELLVNVEIGLQVRESVCEQHEDEECKCTCDCESIRGLQQYLLQFAEECGCGDMVEKVEDTLVINEETTCEQIEDVVEEFTSRAFWEELITELGQRDLAHDLPEKELDAVCDDFEAFREKTAPYFEKYEKEFEDHGIERLKIVE